MKDMKQAKDQGWGKITPVIAPLPGEPKERHSRYVSSRGGIAIGAIDRGGIYLLQHFGLLMLPSSLEAWDRRAA
jgi:hypothetical protein